MLSPAPAHAQDEIDEAPSKTLQDHSERERLGPEKTDRKARELFEKGRSAWDEGRFREAWEYWHHSYRLSRRPELLYNVGQAADRLRMDREALEAFQLYLEKNPNASNRKEVENRIRILQREVDKAPSEERTDYLSEGLGDDQLATAAVNDGEPASEDYRGEDYRGEVSPEAEGPGAGRRSDLYLRGSLGAGFWAANVSNNAGQSGSLSSLTLTFDAFVGWGVLPELAIAGGLLFEFALAPSYDGGGGSGSSDAQVSLGMLAGMADYFLDPDDGWHLFGGLGLGRMAVSGGGVGNEDAGGGALFAGAGYDLEMGEEVTVGLSARLLLGSFSNDTSTFGVFAPTILATASWL